MSRSFALVAMFAILTGGLALVASPSSGQDAKALEPAEKVRFESADGVKLAGDFYRSPAKGAPVVMMLHNIGESSAKEKWIDLAKTLQPSFSVLTFDFRGHGASIEIDPELYFKYPPNVRATKGGANPRKTKLDWKEIDKNSYSLFINDIAAAKGYLERTQNDLGTCNTANTIVIGVDQGATLAAIWANSEFHRYKIDFPPPLFQVRPENKSEGQYLTALVCLGINPKLGSRSVSLVKTLDYPCRQNYLPALFVHGDGDPKDKASLQDRDVAKMLEKAIKIPIGKKTDPRLAQTRAIELKGAGKLRGVDLLAKSLNSSQGINAYLKNLTSEKTNEWSQHEFVKTKFAWKVSPDPNELPIPAKVFKEDTPFNPNPLFPLGTVLPDAVDRNLAYDTYETFIGR